MKGFVSDMDWPRAGRGWAGCSPGSHSNSLSTLQSGQEGLGRAASGLESISALPGQHSVPLPRSYGQHSVSAWAKPSSAARGRLFAFSLLCRKETCLGSAQLCSAVSDGCPMGAQGPCSCSDPSWVCPEPADPGPAGTCELRRLRGAPRTVLSSQPGWAGV